MVKCILLHIDSHRQVSVVLATIFMLSQSEANPPRTHPFNKMHIY